MTPLALQLAADHSNPRIEAYFREARGWTTLKFHMFVRDILPRAKFFELSEVTSLAFETAQKMRDQYDELDVVDTRLAFLPAEVTWLEFECPGFRDDESVSNQEILRAMINKTARAHRPWTYTYRIAQILIGQKGSSTHSARRVQVGYETPLPPGGERVWCAADMSTLPLVHSGIKPSRHKIYENASGQIEEFDHPVADLSEFTNYAMLALINSPRFIGRRQHMPHERIEREKLKTMNLVGKFPLHAWTEILLTVAPPTIGGSEVHEAHLTGEKCLHFCRTHLRVRYGQLEYVEGHWRGNPALGMKRSRYRLDTESQPKEKSK